MLKSVVYTSVATMPIDNVVLKDILAASTRNNKALQLTGLLLYFDGTFIQVLEGPAENVDMMIERIKRDSRNKNMTILLDNEIEEREFGEWDMGFKRVYENQDLSETLKLNIIDRLKEGSDVKVILKTFYEINIDSGIQYVF